MRLDRALRAAVSACLAALFTTPAYARATVGNGANVVVCGSAPNVAPSLELLDYFELRQSGGKLRLNPALGSYPAMLKDLFQSWRSVAPRRIALYEKWLSGFEKEAGFYSGIQISPTEDTGAINIPAGCEVIPAAYQHPEEEVFQNVKRYVLNKDLWNLLSEVERAGLVLHELIYREAVQAGHSSSYPTRYFNGYLASAVPKSLEYSLVVQQLPLEWVEYGSGLLLELKKSAAPQFPFGPQRYSKITEDGFVTGNAYNPSTYGTPFNDYQKGSYLGFAGDVSSEHLKIQFKSFSSATTYVATKIMITGTEVLLSDLRKTQIKSIFASIDKASIELIDLPIQISSYRLVNPRNGIQIVLTTPDKHPDELSVNPASSFYVQADGSVIRSIAKILRNGTCPAECNQSEYALYGNTLVTAAGETWAYDPGKSKYIRR